MADPRWPSFGNDDIITRYMTSSPPIADLKENIFRHAIYSPSLIVIAFIPGPRRQKARSRYGLLSHFQNSCGSGEMQNAG